MLNFVATTKHQRLERNSIERMVEDLIQESMKRGDFDNLPGKGKPIEHIRNPALDLTTQKINQMMAKDGFSPEWILLEKEIRADIEALRENARKRLCEHDMKMKNRFSSEKTSYFSNWRPSKRKLSDENVSEDSKTTKSHELKIGEELKSQLSEQIEDVYRKIDNYNLICPVLFKQMAHLSIEKEIHRAKQRTAKSESNV